MSFSILEKGVEQAWAAGAARGGPGWAGGGTSIPFYLIPRSKEGIHDAQSVNDLPVLHVFGQEYLASGDQGAAELE